jgi:hypothetical protein
MTLRPIFARVARNLIGRIRRHRDQLTALPRCPATRDYERKRRETTRLLAAEVRDRTGREVGPAWAR